MAPPMVPGPVPRWQVALITVSVRDGAYRLDAAYRILL